MLWGMKSAAAVYGLAMMLSTQTLAMDGDPMAGRFGNTVRLTAKDGKVSKVYYNVDKSVVVLRPDGSILNGTWAIEGEKLCVSVAVTLTSVKRCAPFLPHKRAGDTWEQNDADGNPVTATIMPGRQ